MTLGHRRLAAGVLTAALLPFFSGPRVMALSCIGHDDLLVAAEELVAGEHPGWADTSIVGRVDTIERAEFAPIILVVTPTHVFGGDVPDGIRLAARSDGPPDPQSWTVGAHYFLALETASGVEGLSAIVAPCAPNFVIETADELERLVSAAAEVEVREPGIAQSSSDLHLGTTLAIGLGVGMIGLGSWLTYRRRSTPGERR